MNSNIKAHLGALKGFVENGGPNPEDYDYIRSATMDMLNIGIVEDQKVYDLLIPVLDGNSMIGFTYQKPHGYAGDFELIDRIYSNWISPDESQKKWDLLYQNAGSAFAVRNRKDYIQKELIKVESIRSDANILNVGSGPCTDLHEYFRFSSHSALKIDCLDMDNKALEFGSAVCDNYSDSLTFINKNVFKFSTDKSYDLVWSAGLFDYFSDKLFVRLLNKMYSLVKPGGELVIGNFSTKNESRGLMEILCRWYLHHRTKDELFELAIKAGVAKQQIRIDEEAMGINLFLHIKK